jgi:hypothetical protein
MDKKNNDEYVYHYNATTVFDDIKKTTDKSTEIKNDYDSRFSKAVGCTPDVARSIEALYANINDAAEIQIGKLDAQFKDVRKQTSFFFDTLLKTVKSNNDAIEKLSIALPNEAFSSKIKDDIMASIKSYKDENTEITNALTSFMTSCVIPKEITHIVQSIIPRVEEPIGANNCAFVEDTQRVEDIVGFHLDNDDLMSPYPDVFDTAIKPYPDISLVSSWLKGNIM